MSCTVNLYVGNSSVCELTGLKNSVTGVADTGATVNVTLYSGDTEVTGQTWPASMAHVADGTYRVTLNHDISIQAGYTYTAVITATGSGSEVGRWELTGQAQTRKCS